MQPKPRRGNVVLLGDGVFEVLGLIKIRPPGPWWWHTEDLSDPGGARGAIFRCYEDGHVATNGELQELACLMAADVTDDPTEPDISRFEQADADTVVVLSCPELDGAALQTSLEQRSDSIWRGAASARVGAGQHSAKATVVDEHGRSGSFRWTFEVAP